MIGEIMALGAVARGILEIDEMGQIWRCGKLHNGGKFIPLKRRRAEAVSTNGYLRLWFMSGRKHYTCQAHRLVWVNTNGTIPPNNQINHKNGIKADNRLCNLEVATASENQLHALHVIKTARARRGEQHPGARLCREDIIELRKRFNCHDVSRTELAQMYGICVRQLYRIANRARWAHVK